MARPLTMAETAEEVGLSYERFRKVWRALPAFPAPIRGRVWDPDAIAAWKAGRSRPERAPPARAYLVPTGKPQALRAALEAIRNAG